MMARRSFLAALAGVVSSPAFADDGGAADLFVKSVALHDWAIAAPVLLSFAALTLTADFIGRCAGRPLADPGTPP